MYSRSRGSSNTPLGVFWKRFSFCMTFLKLEICIVWRSVIKFGVLCRAHRSRFSPSFGASKVQNLRFLEISLLTLRFWALRAVFVVGLYRALYAWTIGTEIEVIRFLVRELWFLKCFLYYENYVFTCFLDFFFFFDHYKILESDHSAYEDSKTFMVKIPTTIISPAIVVAKS